MSKVPCGGFKLDNNFLSMNENDELSLTGGSEGNVYKQLVTDGSGEAKWEDRIAYYTDPVVTEIIPEETVAFEMSSGVMQAIWPTTFSPVDGSTYVVKIDGTEYECTCFLYYSVQVIGNLSILGIEDVMNTGEPFVMFNSGQWAFASNSSAVEHTISIYGKTSQLIQIPEKYLPDSAFTKAEWNMVSGKPIDKIELNETVSPDTEIGISMNAGLTFSDSFFDIDFVPGNLYEINGTITLNYGKTPSYPDTLTVNGLYLADNSAKITLGDLITSYGGKNISVYLYGKNSAYDGCLGLSSSFRDTVSATVDINFSAVYKRLDEVYIPDTIQRVGGDVIISSSTPDSKKKFKITVDDSGAISATEVTT